MPDFSYPHMPVYTHDNATYIRQMHDWHMRMHHYHDQKRAYHMERARHFQRMMGIQALPPGRPEEDSAAS